MKEVKVSEGVSPGKTPKIGLKYASFGVSNTQISPKNPPKYANPDKGRPVLGVSNTLIPGLTPAGASRGLLNAILAGFGQLPVYQQFGQLQASEARDISILPVVVHNSDCKSVIAPWSLHVHWSMIELHIPTSVKISESHSKGCPGPGPDR